MSATPPPDPAGHHSGNSRNGARSKTVITDVGPVEIDVPRDRAGTFEPVIVPMGEKPPASGAFSGCEGHWCRAAGPEVHWIHGARMLIPSSSESTTMGRVECVFRGSRRLGKVPAAMCGS